MNILSFHESTVTKFVTEQNDFVIGLEGVSTDCSSDKVEIVVEKFSEILVDSLSPSEDSLKMPYADGEVLTLELSGGTVFALIEWNDFCSGKSFTQSYEVTGNKIEIFILV